MTDKERIEQAMEFINEYGHIDGAHHKQWVLDQIARVLLGDAYTEWAAPHSDEWGGWEVGIAP